MTSLKDQYQEQCNSKDKMIHDLNLLIENMKQAASLLATQHRGNSSIVISSNNVLYHFISIYSLIFY